jgi:hypothetical protein
MKLKLKLRKKTYKEFCQEIVKAYIKETKKIIFDMNDVADWAIEKGLWDKPFRNNARKECARALAQASRDEYYTDPQGRRVRTKHAARHEQGWLWADIKSAPPAHMRLSLQQRRQSIVGDCKQLKTDLDSYNDNNIHGAQIQMDFDFNLDLHELSMPIEYPEHKPN